MNKQFRLPGMHARTTAWGTAFLIVCGIGIIVFSGLGCRALAGPIEPPAKDPLILEPASVELTLTPTPIVPTTTPLPPTPTPEPPTAVPTKTAVPPTETSVPPTETPTQVPPTPTPEFDFLIMQLNPEDGDLATQLQVEAQMATTLGLKPFVEFYADWCPACQAINESIDQPRMKDAFKGTYIIQINTDDWTEEAWQEAGFEFIYIPVYYRLDEQGRPTGDWIDGSAWEENIPVNMAPPLKEFFQGNE